MKIIYHCYGGTHSSVTAAAAHLDMLPQDRSPSCRELLAIPFFDCQDSTDHGHITMMGTDHHGHEIYFMGQRGSPRLLENIIYGLAHHFAIPDQEYKLVNVLDKVNMSMRIGGILSRGFKWINVGRPLVTWGTTRAYHSILQLVESVKSQGAS